MNIDYFKPEDFREIVKLTGLATKDVIDDYSASLARVANAKLSRAPMIFMNAKLPPNKSYWWNEIQQEEDEVLKGGATHSGYVVGISRIAPIYEEDEK